jgi:bis(5'-nucleosyl)-tetraphosphatase (symmetrical)
MPEGYQPWFNFNGQVERSHRIIFGHWAALQAKPIRQNVVAVDGGCVWGGELVAFNLKNEEQFKISNPL